MTSLSFPSGHVTPMTPPQPRRHVTQGAAPTVPPCYPYSRDHVTTMGHMTLLFTPSINPLPRSHDTPDHTPTPQSRDPGSSSTIPSGHPYGKDHVTAKDHMTFLFTPPPLPGSRDTPDPHTKAT